MARFAELGRSVKSEMTMICVGHLYMDFKIGECRHRDEFLEVLDKYVDFYNKHRPSYAIGYDTSAGYRERFSRARLRRKIFFVSTFLDWCNGQIIYWGLCK